MPKKNASKATSKPLKRLVTGCTGNCIFCIALYQCVKERADDKLSDKNGRS